MRAKLLGLGIILGTVGLGVWALPSTAGVHGRGETAQQADPAVPKDHEEARAADRAAIQKTVQGLIAAFARGDAAQVAAHLTAGAELIPDDAPPVRGRDAIQKSCVAHFAKSPKQKIMLEVESLRFMARDAAVEEGHMSVSIGKEAPTSQRYSFLHVREDGKWLVAAIREWPSEMAELRDLQWLIGSWEAKRANGKVHATYEWFGDKSFIRANITIQNKDRKFSGMQLIGADPRTGELRIWLFESDGGFAEGTCTRDGKTWRFQTEGVLANGGKLAATNLLVRVDHDTITWQPVNLTLDEEQLVGLPPVKVTRSRTKN